MWGFTVRALSLGAFLLVLTTATSARAERILLVPTGGTPSLEREATRLVERLSNSLEEAGHETRIANGREVELAASVLGCDTSACASAGLMSLDVGFVAAPALWAAPQGRNELSLTAIGTRGVALDFTRTVAPGDESEAADALAAELAAQLDRLAVDPEPGRDDAHGLASGRSTASSLMAPAPARPRRRSAWNVGLGLGLVLVGLAPLSLSGISLARRGECVAPTQDGRCPWDENGRYEVYDFGSRSLAVLVGGVGAVGAGITFLVARPIRVRPIADVSGRASGLGIDLRF